MNTLSDSSSAGPGQSAIRGKDQTFLTSKQLAELLGRKPQTIRAWRLNGNGPRYVRLGEGTKAPVIYRMSDVEEWLAARTFQSTAEEEAS